MRCRDPTVGSIAGGALKSGPWWEESSAHVGVSLFVGLLADYGFRALLDDFLTDWLGGRFELRGPSEGSFV